ncbi:hypothetical protein C8J57DRAFT_1221564 [Mycena rebaudengoi]|nr:hypothetical protein C8J57DRAFT_1221564 [Mycena rebaudengoi]
MSCSSCQNCLAWRHTPAATNVVGTCHNEILAHSKTLPGTSNAGSMFWKAEGVLWVAEPQDTWEAAANSVDWVERQALVPLGFKTMVNQLKLSGKFMPFLAMMLMAWVDADGKVHIDWTEGAPPGIAVPHTFIKQHGHLVQHNIDAMYKWAACPLKGCEVNDHIDHVTGGVDSANAQLPFPLTVDDLDYIAPRVLTQKVTAFLIESYNGVFGTPEIPWAKIASNLMEYYDTHKFTFPFTASGLADLSRPQWDVLATMLALGARSETPGFWHQPRHKSKADADAAEAKSKADVDAAAAKTKADTNATAAAAKTKEDSEVEALERDWAAAVEAESSRKRSKKRKADSELVPETAGDTRRPLRTRRTPVAECKGSLLLHAVQNTATGTLIEVLVKNNKRSLSSHYFDLPKGPNGPGLNHGPFGPQLVGIFQEYRSSWV